MAKPDQHVAANYRFVISVRATAAFALSSIVLAGLTLSVGSHEVHRLSDRLPWFEVMHGITALGDGSFAVVVAIWLALRGSSRQEWLIFGVGFAAAALIPQVGKHLIWPDAARPYGMVDGIRLSQLLDPAVYKSFPSGHSAVGAFFALFLSYRKPAWSWLYIGLGILVGISRIALHYHWTEDVLAGWAIGLCSAWLAERTLGPKLTSHGIT